MKWPNFSLWASLLILSLLQNTTRAQSHVEPIKAKQRKITYQIQSDGSKTLKLEEAGTFYRSSSGATMNTVGDRSIFVDEHGNTYNIVHSKKVATFVVRSPELLHDVIKKTPPESIQGYEMVNGLQCAIGGVLLNGKPVGKKYSNLPYGLMVKIEVTEPDSSYMTVRELYDIQVSEPDSALVRIPVGYAIHKKPEP